MVQINCIAFATPSVYVKYQTNIVWGLCDMALRFQVSCLDLIEFFFVKIFLHQLSTKFRNKVNMTFINFRDFI